MRHPLIALLAAVPLAMAPSATRQAGYLGSEACGQCHDEIHKIQSQSNMARTWVEFGEGGFDQDYSKEVREGRFVHRVYGRADGLRYRVQGPEGREVELPVAVITGSKRIGSGFLLRFEEIAGERLWRPALLEARYMEGREGGLELAPGHHLFQPTTIESALGRVLNREFEAKCLTCHGSPAHQPTGEAGVTCENCHGPGLKHLQALEAGADDPAVVNPAKLAPAMALEICGACHAGFSQARQPRPQDLLISDQVRALSQSECYVQSGEAFSCVNCHNPHENVRRGDPVYQRTCLSCHAVALQKAAPCPVNRDSGCTDCHMPAVKMGDLELVDHWIRVHPETGERDPALKPVPSRIKPRRLFLREIVTGDLESVREAQRRLQRGEPFDEVARLLSVAPSATYGGFLGGLRTERMTDALATAAVTLRPGETSPVLNSQPPYKLVQRLPRDFRFEAMALAEEASQAMARGDLKTAVAKLERAVAAHPHDIRAINLLAIARAQTGDLPKALETLERATRLAPDDPESSLLTARALTMAGRREEAVEWLSRAVALDPNSLGARLQLGAALYGAARLEEAARQFKAAAEINPLSAPAYFNLAQTELRLGRPEEAERLLRIARALDPELVRPGS